MTRGSPAAHEQGGCQIFHRRFLFAPIAWWALPFSYNGERDQWKKATNKKQQTKKWADPISKIVTSNYFWSPRKSFDYSSTSNLVQNILSPSAMQDSHFPITQGGKTMFSDESQDKTTLSLVYVGSPLCHSSCGLWLGWCHKGVLSGQQRRALLCRTVSQAWQIAEYHICGIKLYAT